MFDAMRRMIFPIIIIVLFFFAGCASLMPKQFLEDNVFYCSYPEVKIKVSPEFEYLCDVKYNTEGDSIDGTRVLRHDMYSYVFLSEKAVKPYVLLI